MSEEHPVIGIGNSADPLIGTVLAERYRIEKKLGEGGMGAVYLARHVILEKIVALKILHDEYARRRELVERFLHEAKAASRIRHEHVIDITDFGETATKNVFFAMEFLDGQDLATELDKPEPMAWRRVKSIILQLCAALQAAHEAGVIHRDLKPENIYLIERLGNPDFVKVLDFGVAKLTELEESRERRLTRTGMVFGTPEYMSPEQARGEKPDARVDIYATGCILFQMLTGDVPYRADNFMGVLTKHLFDPTPVIKDRTGRTDLPAGLQSLLLQAMAKDKTQRFNSMHELAVALDTLDNTEGVVYHALSSLAHERSRRHLAGSGVPSAAIPSSGSGPHRKSPPSSERPAAPPPPVLPISAAPDPFGETHLDTPIARDFSIPPISDEERTLPRIPAATPVVSGTEGEVETEDFERLPRRKGLGLYVLAGGLAVGLGAVALMLARRVPDPVPLEIRPPAAIAEPAAAVAAPSPSPEPAAALPAVDAVVREPAAAEVLPEVLPPPGEPAAHAVGPVPVPVPVPVRIRVEEKKPLRPAHRDRERERPKPARSVAPLSPSLPAVVGQAPPAARPAEPSSPAPDPGLPKSDLKDPFSKKR